MLTVMSLTESDRPATFADLLALGDDDRTEIINGVLVPKEAAKPRHSECQGAINADVATRFRGSRREGGDRPGGWRILVEAETEYEPHELYKHDIAGWRRERMPETPGERPIRVVPDWACEVLSPSTRGNDSIRKLRVLQRHKVPRYWLVDLEADAIHGYEWREGVYALVVTARVGESHRLPPFDAVEFDISQLLGGDPVD